MSICCYNLKLALIPGEEERRLVLQYFTNTTANFLHALFLSTSPLPPYLKAVCMSPCSEVIPVRSRVLVNLQCTFLEEFNCQVLGASFDVWHFLKKRLINFETAIKGILG